MGRPTAPHSVGRGFKPRFAPLSFRNLKFEIRKDRDEPVRQRR